MKPHRLLRIGEVARLVGIHPSTVRNLEARGLLTPARDWAGQRRFGAKDVARLRSLIESRAHDLHPPRNPDDARITAPNLPAPR